MIGLVVLTPRAGRGQPSGAAPPAAQCELIFQTTDQSWKGLCGPFLVNKEPTTLTARKVASLPGGAGRGDVSSTLMLVGELKDTSTTSPIELEFFGKSGIIRTQAGWRVVALANETPTLLAFRVEAAEPEPTDVDRRIVERAREILASEAVWNRADNRVCTPEDKTWSVYCAIDRASLEVSGGFHHRRPCLQVMRALLYERVAEERKKGHKYPHILMDYNNDSATRFVDVQSAFAETLARMKR